jgi:hypothetical protein
MEDQLSIDALSLDTQLSLLADLPCKDVVSSTESIAEIADLGNRLAYTEAQLGSGNEQVIRLKKRYTLLEIRAYLATKELALTCGMKPVTVLYFYSNSGDCPDCDKAGYALSYLHDAYPTFRVYSFDYHLGLGALETLIDIEGVEARLPAFVIDGKVSYGFVSLADFEARFPKGMLSPRATSSGARSLSH